MANKLLYTWDKIKSVDTDSLYSYSESIIFDGNKRTLWHKGRQFGNSYYMTDDTIGGETFNDFATNTATGVYSHAEGGHTGTFGAYSHAEGLYSKAYDTGSHAEGGHTGTFGAYSHAEGLYTTTSNTASHAEGGCTTASGAYSHAEGYSTQTVEDYSHAEGESTVAFATASHAEGVSTETQGLASHAEGGHTGTFGAYSHAEGLYSKAYDTGSHAEGGHTGTFGAYSHAEGLYTTTSNTASHAEGGCTTASGAYSHAEGYSTQTVEDYSHAEGESTVAFATASHAEGVSTETQGLASHAEGGHTGTFGAYSHAEGLYTTADRTAAHAEGGYNNAKSAYSHAEGLYTDAVGIASHAEGGHTEASAYAHAEGYHTIAAEYSHAEGLYTHTYDTASHAEGGHTTAASPYSHAEGYHTITRAPYSHAEGLYSKAYYTAAHAEGGYTDASGEYSHAEGYHTQTFNTASHAEGGDTTAASPYSHAEGYYTITRASYSHAEGLYSKAYYTAAHAEGGYTDASGEYSHAEGYHTQTFNTASHAEGGDTTAASPYSHAEGYYTITRASYSHAEGLYSKAYYTAAHAEGGYTDASGEYSHAEGYHTQTFNTASHAEGGDTTAASPYSHAEGYYTITRASYSHAEGYHTQASSTAAHAEGGHTDASGAYSHAEGLYTDADHTGCHAEGCYTRSGLNMYSSSTITAAHAEGFGTMAGLSYHGDSNNPPIGAHAEGVVTKANVFASHSEGSYSIADGIASHSEGAYTCALASYSHASGLLTYSFGIASASFGIGTETRNDAEVAIGSYNITYRYGSAVGNTLFTIGDGTSYAARHNILGIHAKSYDNVQYHNPKMTFNGDINAYNLRATGGVTAYAGIFTGNDVTINDAVVLTTKQPTEYIDLGLPSGTLWATKNVGGDTTRYFQWGETRGYTIEDIPAKMKFSWNDYKYAKGSNNGLIKYCNVSDYGFNQYTDNLNVLETNDDAAAVSCIDGVAPTTEQAMELLLNTDVYLIKADGTAIHGTFYHSMMGLVWDNPPAQIELLSGVEFRSKTLADVKLFVPADGGSFEGNTQLIGHAGGFWLANVAPVPKNGNALYFDNSVCAVTPLLRPYGVPFRAVKSVESPDIHASIPLSGGVIATEASVDTLRTEMKDNAQLSADLTTSVTVGKVPAGSKYDAGTSISSIINDIFNYATPTFATLNILLNDGGSPITNSQNVFCNSSAMTLKSVIHREANIASIKGGTVTLDINGTTQTIDAVTTNTSVPSSAIFNRSTNKATFYVRLTGISTLSSAMTAKQLTLAAYMPVYCFTTADQTDDTIKTGLTNAANMPTVYTGAHSITQTSTFVAGGAWCVALPSHMKMTKIGTEADFGFGTYKTTVPTVSATRTVNGINNVPYTIYVFGIGTPQTNLTMRIDTAAK